MPEQSPARHVRDLRVLIGGHDCVPEDEFFEYTPWFAKAEKVSLFGDGRFSPLRTPSFWRLPQSVTSLAIQTKVFTLVDIRDILAQLPNLDDFSLSGHLARGREPLEVGTALGGRFGGKLQLFDGPAQEDVMNMLSEIQTGLRFTEMQVCGTRRSLLSTVRLAEACGSTLVGLSYTISESGKSHSFRSWWLWHLH